MLIVVMTTVATAPDGETLAEKLVEARLATCVQILPAMTSIYRWEGEIQKESEHLLLIKTLAKRYDELESFLLANHPYDVPEIVALESDRVSQSFLDFALETTRV
jgi:periplasmic divalent cation tolerance protein